MTAPIPAGQLHGVFAAELIDRAKDRWGSQMQVVIDRPPLLVDLIAQEVGELVTIDCPTCAGEGVAHLTSTSGYKSTCRECEGGKTIQVPASELDGLA